MLTTLTPSPVWRFTCRALAVLLVWAGMTYWGNHPHAWTGQGALAAGMGMGWILSSLSSVTMDLGEKQGLAWNGFASICFYRGQCQLTKGKQQWEVSDVVTGKSQRLDVRWLSDGQRQALASWNRPEKA